MVTTNCLTGEAEYFEEKSSSQRVMDIVRASSSLPFVSPVTYVDETPMLDGGIVDLIPVEYAMTNGYKRIVAVNILSFKRHWPNATTDTTRLWT
jgi:predicted patatin/cPLA2 family phospholipase